MVRKHSLDKGKWVLFEEAGIKQLYQQYRDQGELFTQGNAACLGCPAELGLRFTMRVLGKNTILALPPGCMGGVGMGMGANAGATIPTFFPLLDNVASMLTGIKRHYQREGREVVVAAFAGDGGTADVGFQSLSGATERGENILYICYDNEGYMNTGVQRSGTTPHHAWTTTTPVADRARGKAQRSKDMPVIMMMHGAPYVATATTAFMADYHAKLQRALQVKDGLAYIHLFTPCPTGWKFGTERSIDVGRLAVETNLFPLWEADHGRIRFTKHVRFPRPLREYTSLMGKYQHLTDAEIAGLQQEVNDRYRRLKAMSRL